ncbi:methyltransferase [Maridesulfovibrio sp.]|uniref:methyltransferase n=1 Tax=Maridesulfovibrio sp. TaxID=2795000 RepID=UPI0029CAA7D0|nr:methyltransferase [Maridesulfovibrio sp.]
MNYPIPEQDFAPVRSMIMRGVTAQVIMEAVKFKLFDALEVKPRSKSELAEFFEFDELMLGSILDLLESCNLVQKRHNIISNTPVASEYLVSTSPLYQGLSIELVMGFCTAVNHDMGNLLRGKKSKRDENDSNWSAVEVMEGTAQEALSSGMHETVSAISSLPGFGDFRLMGDLGGNHGNYTMALLERNPKMNGILMDQPHVVPLAEERCRNMGYGKRVNTVGLDMHKDELPQMDFDLFFVSHVLYACRGNIKPLLDKIAKSIRPGGWFCANHYAKTESRLPPQTMASLEVITTFSGYFSHFIEPDILENNLRDCGFGNFSRTWSDSSKGILLVSAQKLK